ncbi:MAG: hypothetical protein IJ774_09230 [Selenomonadaceae bacterium]|nr:hypothetical protein [Selenomonadaceae bacterium]
MATWTLHPIWFGVFASIGETATNCSPAFKAGLLRQKKSNIQLANIVKLIEKLRR